MYTSDNPTPPRVSLSDALSTHQRLCQPHERIDYEQVATAVLRTYRRLLNLLEKAGYHQDMRALWDRDHKVLREMDEAMCNPEFMQWLGSGASAPDAPVATYALETEAEAYYEAQDAAQSLSFLAISRYWYSGFLFGLNLT